LLPHGKECKEIKGLCDDKSLGGCWDKAVSRRGGKKCGACLSLLEAEGACNATSSSMQRLRHRSQRIKVYVVM
jgi:hypothetical protein